MLFVEIIVFYHEKDSEHTKRLYGENAEMSVKQAKQRGGQACLFEGASANCL